jgi:hypothetical protein
MSKPIQSPKGSDSGKKQIVLRTGGTAVKITFEMGDTEPLTASAKDGKTAVEEVPPETKPPVAAESKPAESKPETKPAAEAKPIPESKPVVVEVPASANPAPPANPLHSFDLQGGVNDILDPSRGNPNCYQFVQPKGEA